MAIVFQGNYQAALSAFPDLLELHAMEELLHTV